MDSRRVRIANERRWIRIILIGFTPVVVKFSPVIKEWLYIVTK